MDLEILLKSSEYKKMKQEHEKTYFKLFGKYCQINKNDNITERTSTEMCEKFKNKKITVDYTEETTTKKGVTISTTKKLQRTFFDIWSNDPTIPEFDSIIFDCDLSKVDKMEYNLFKGFTHFDNQNLNIVDLSDLHEHIKSLVNFDIDDYEYVLNWLAYLIQHPELIPDKALVFISEEGIGKDLFAELLENVVGENYFGTTEKLDLVCGRFNSFLAGKLLCVLNETNPIESTQRIENIKAMITAKKLEIEEKYKTPIKCNNFVRFIFFSNRPFAFPVEDGARRPKIMQGSTKYLPINYGVEASAKHFTNLANKFKDKNFQYSFLQFLKTRDITKFNPRQYKKSEFHEILIEASRDPIVSFMAEYLKNADKEIVKVQSTELLQEYTLYLKEHNYKFDSSPKKFTIDLKLKFNVSTRKNSSTYFIIDVSYTKKILTEKYKYKFAVNEENDENNQNPLDHGIEDNNESNEKDELKKENEELKKKLKELEEQIKILSQTNSKEEGSKVDTQETNYELYYPTSSQDFPSMSEKYYIHVPYNKYKDIAKKHGAKYDKELNRWYVLDNHLELIDVFKTENFSKYGEL